MENVPGFFQIQLISASAAINAATDIDAGSGEFLEDLSADPLLFSGVFRIPAARASRAIFCVRWSTAIILAGSP